MIFMSVSMDSVWSMYLMMQIASNIIHLDLNIPGNVGYLLFVFEKISYFKITEEENFQQYLKIYVFDRARWFYDIIDVQGTFLMSIEILMASLFLICLFNKFKKNRYEIIDKLK